jgi:hypothetical protein
MLWATKPQRARGQRCGHEVLRSQAAQAGVALGSLRHLARIEARRQVGQLMHHDVQLRCRDRTRQRRRIEDIDHDGHGACGLQRVGFRCGTGRAGDVVAGFKQKRMAPVAPAKKIFIPLPNRVDHAGTPHAGREQGASLNGGFP